MIESNNFKTLVQKRKIKWPTERGFNEKKWNQAWENNKTEDDSLFQAGNVFNSIFSEIRTALVDLYSKAPKMTKDDLLKAQCAISNRDRFIAARPVQSPEDLPESIHAITTSENIMSNTLTLQDVAEGSVEGAQKAIFFLINSEQNIVNGDNSLDFIEYTKNENILSQMYNLYENYWHALVWNEYRFIERDKDKKIFEIIQENSYFEVASLLSQQRKLKLGGQASSIHSLDSITNLFRNDNYITTRIINKRKDLTAKKITTASKSLQESNSDIRSSAIKIEKLFPQSFIIDVPKGYEFNIRDIIQVFRLLVLLAKQSIETFPKDDSVYTRSKLLSFCPVVKKIDLSRSISKALNMSHKKVINILDFLTYDGSNKKDLWCYPLLKLNSNKLTYLVSALVAPVLTRVVEHWIVKMNIDLNEKGETFEKEIINITNRSLIE